MPKPIIVILFPIVLALSSRAEDWPQWRGSGRDGVWHESGIRKTFPAGGLPVRWRAPVGYGFENAKPLSVCGRRHAMGGQQFLTNHLLLDTTRLRRVLKFDPDRGTIEAEAG